MGLIEWGAFKVGVHGHCFCHSLEIQQELNGELQVPDGRLHGLDNALGTDATALEQLREQYNIPLERLRCHDYKAYMARVYDEGSRPGRLLAWLIRLESQGAPITHIQAYTSESLYSPEAINALFREYYKILYNSPNPVPLMTQLAFLNRLPLLDLPQFAKDELGGLVSVQEISFTIKEMATGRTTGPNGLPAELYPHLLRIWPEDLRLCMLNLCHWGNCLLLSMTQS